MAKRKNRLRYLVLIFASWWVIYPIATSVQESFEIDLGPLYSGRGVSFVGQFFQGSGGIMPTAINYLQAFRIEAWPRLVFNSSIIALSSVSIALIVGIPAAYSFAMYKYRGKTILTIGLLALRTISPFAVLVPFFIVYGQLGLFDTFQGMAIIYLVLNLPIVILMMRGFFKEIPKEIYEAAFLSGASDMTIMRRIALPLVIPGMVAVVLFAFVATWNEYLYALILTGARSKTVSRGVWSGFGESIQGFKILDFDELNTAGTLALIPAIVIVLLVRKYLVRGVTLGAAK